MKNLTKPIKHIPKEIVQQFLPDNPIIVEAGAHIGRGSKHLARFWPNSTVHSFEPVPELYQRLIQKTGKFENIKRYNMALSDATGTAPLHISSGRCTSASSLLQPHDYLNERPDVLFEEIIQVQAITIDDWAQQQNITAIDLLWLDMQGAELLALHGAQTMLQTVRAIHTEINTTERYKGNPLYEELHSFLIKHGFVEHMKLLDDGTWGNALFVKKSPRQSLRD